MNAYTIINNSNEENTTAWKAMVDYVAGTARGARRDRIMKCKPGDIPTGRYFGYLERLKYDPVENKAYYIVGQDGTAEHRAIRAIFDPRK